MSPVSTHFFRLAAVLLAATVALSAPISAQADETGPRTLKVHYSDLDLTTRQGQSELERRIERAVKRVCAPLDDKQIRFVVKSIECREATLATADAGLRRAIASVERYRHVGG
jgi:UrcA family protein